MPPHQHPHQHPHEHDHEHPHGHAHPPHHPPEPPMPADRPQPPHHDGPHSPEHPFAHPEFARPSGIAKWLNMPVAIIIAAIIIGGAMLISGRGTTYTVPKAKIATVLIPAPTVDDRRLGNPDSPVTIVEYSDTECPYCKVFQQTMHDLIDSYGKDGTVSWVYRHFPLYKPGPDGRSLHSRAGKEAEASECAFELGGMSGFWKYLDQVYSITNSNNSLDPAQLYVIAKNLGFDSTAFRSCLDSDRYAERISKAFEDAVAAGGTGTPYVALIAKKKITSRTQSKIYEAITEAIRKENPNAMLPADFFTFDQDGHKIVWSGALPLDMLKLVIDHVK